MASFLSFCTICFVDFLHINDFIAFLDCTVSRICLLNRLLNLNHKTKWGRNMCLASLIWIYSRYISGMNETPHWNCTSRPHRGTDHTLECFTKVLTVFYWLKMGPPLLQNKNSTRTYTVIPKHKNNLFIYVYIYINCFTVFRNNIYTVSFCDCSSTFNTYYF